MNITGEQVRKAAIAKKLTRIPHHDCSICGWWVAHVVQDGELFFDPSCWCSFGPKPLEPVTWDSVADCINMQTNEKAREHIMDGFGMLPNGEVKP